MLGTPDRLVGSSLATATAGVEVKTTGAHRGGEWDNGSAPWAAQLQCLHLLAVTGLPVWHLVCLIGGHDLRHVEIRADDHGETLEALVAAEGRLWQHVVDRVEPAADDSPITTRALAAVYPDDGGGVVEVDEAFLAALEQRRMGKATEAAGANVVAAAENVLKQTMGNAATAIYQGEVVATWKSHKRAGHFVEPHTARPLRIPNRKG